MATNGFAATLTYDSSGSGSVVYTAADDEENRVFIADAGAEEVSIADTSGTLAAPSGCTKETDVYGTFDSFTYFFKDTADVYAVIDSAVTCSAQSIEINTGNGIDDVYGITTASHFFTRKVTISGGAGKDLVEYATDYIPSEEDANYPDVTVSGGSGNDHLVLGSDTERVASAGQFDALSVNGDSGADTIELFSYVKEGVVTAKGGDGQDHVSAAGSLEVSPYSVASYAIYGGTGSDELVGGPGDDAIYGEGSVDAISGGAGSDTLSGGAGNDTLDAGNDEDVDTLDCGLNTDTATVWGVTTAGVFTTDDSTTGCESTENREIY